MADRTGSLLWRLLADSSGFTSGVSSAAKSADDLQKKSDSLGKAMESAGASMVSTGKKMTIGITAPLAGIGVAAFKMAADFEDATGTTQQMFGASAKQVQSWANDLETYFGVSRGEALKYSNLMGALLQNIGGMTQAESARMSSTLVELAADMSAAFGGSTEQAINSLMAALKGNTATLDNYGISASQAVINQKALEMGIWDGTGALNAQQEQAAVLNIVMEQTANIQGQAAREADGASGSLKALTTEAKNLATDLGQELLPVASDVMGAMSGLLGVVRDLPGPIKEIGGTLAVGLAAAGPANMAIGHLVENLGKMRQNYSDVVAAGGSKAGGLANVLTSAINPATLIVTGSVVTATAIFAQWHETTKRLKEEQEALAPALLDTAKSVDAINASEIINKDALATMRDARLTFEDLNDVARDGTDAFNEFAHMASQSDENLRVFFQQAIDRSSGAAREFAQQLYDLADAGKITWQEARNLASETDQLADRFDEQAKSAAGATIEMANQLQAAGDLTASQAQLTQTLFDGVDSATEFDAALKTLREEHPQLAEALGLTQQATEGVAGATDDLADAHGNAADEAATQTSQLEELRTAYDDQIAAIRTLGDTLNGELDLERTRLQLQREYDQALADLAPTQNENNRLVSEANLFTAEGALALTDLIGVMNEHIGVMIAEQRPQAEIIAQQGAYRGQLQQVAAALGVSEDEARRYIERLLATPEDIETTVQAHTADANARIDTTQANLNSLENNSPYNVSVRYTASYVGFRDIAAGNIGLNRIGSANGNLFPPGSPVVSFANGGENHQAMISPPILRVWAEPETGGEAYIPLAPHKRRRSTDILSKVAEQFGYGLTQMADGAIVRTGSSGGRVVTTESKTVNISNFFTQPNATADEIARQLAWQHRTLGI